MASTTEHVFDVGTWLNDHPPEKCRTTTVSQPMPLGVGWTKKKAEWLHGNASGLPRLQIPSLPLDLREGLESYQEKDPATSKGFVETLMREARASNVPLKGHCHVLSFRNNLNKIFGTAFDPDFGWSIDGCFMYGILFLEIVQTENAWKDGKSESELKRLDMLEKFGYQFEAKCTGEIAGSPCNEYGIMVKMRLENSEINTKDSIQSAKQEEIQSGIKVYMGAEIDCYDPDIAKRHGWCERDSDTNNRPPLESMCEIKTLRAPQHRGQMNTLLGKKHPKWWIQSYLAGIRNIVLGFRDPKDEGIINKIERCRTNDLVRWSWDRGFRWSPDQALALGTALLHWMRDLTSQPCLAHQHISFEYGPESKMVTATVKSEKQFGSFGYLPKRIASFFDPTAQTDNDKERQVD